MTTALNPENKETWSSRTSFLLAAIGATVGFGNVWRFPAVLHEDGGGAFFFPYLLALIFIGLPLLLHEIATGQHLRKSDVAISGYFSKHFRGVGLASIFCGFCVLCYYVPLIAWCFRVYFESFGPLRVQWSYITGSRTAFYIFEDILGMVTLEEYMKPSKFVIGNIVYLFFTWAIVGSCIAFGVQWTGRMAHFTMGLPLVTLFFLLIRSVTLPGASDGISNYIGSWDWSVLASRPDVWSTAVSQIFFGLGITFGIMTAFGSRCEKNAPAFENSVIIATSNSMFSFLSGFCIFALMGCLAKVEEDFTVKAGPAFLLGAYPASLSTIPLGLHWFRFVFFNFILLGLNSAFAMLQAIVWAIEETTFNTLSRTQLVAVFCTIGFLFGLLYSTDAALHFVDVVDFYLNFIVLFLGFCKAFSAGWMYGIQRQIKILGYNLVYTYILATFGAVSMASLVWFGVGGDSTMLGFISLLTIYGTGMFYCYFRLRKLQMPEEGHTIKTLSVELIMGNVLDLRAELQSSVGYIPYLWAVLMKHVVPQVLLALLINLVFARNDGQWEFGHYGDYRLWPFQTFGLICVVITMLIVGIGLVQARLYDGFVGDLKSMSHAESFEMVKTEQGQDNGTDYMDMTEIEKGDHFPAAETDPPVMVLT